MNEIINKSPMNFPLEKIIEAKVTDNLGYDSNFKKFNISSGINVVDCRGMNYQEAKEIEPHEVENIYFPNENMANLHQHLGEMNHKRVISFNNRFEKTMPKYIYEEYTSISL